MLSIVKRKLKATQRRLKQDVAQRLGNAEETADEEVRPSNGPGFL